jgi:hypothetical protein
MLDLKFLKYVSKPIGASAQAVKIQDKNNTTTISMQIFLICSPLRDDFFIREFTIPPRDLAKIAISS